MFEFGYVGEFADAHAASFVESMHSDRTALFSIDVPGIEEIDDEMLRCTNYAMLPLRLSRITVHVRKTADCRFDGV